jgi:hypothetical protein
MERDGTVAGVPKGWLNDVPMHLYGFIVESFLYVMQGVIGASLNYNAAEFTGEDGYAPFSVAEFNDIIGSTYTEFVTNGDSREKPIVFHTTQSNRNRNIGWYHVFVYNSREVPTIPLPSHGPSHARRIAAGPNIGRSFRDDFWSGLCRAHHIPGGFQISLKAVLVGHLLVTNYLGMLGGGANFRLTADMIKDLYNKEITPDHHLKDLVGDWTPFLQFVKNLLKAKATLNFRDYPEYIGMQDRRKNDYLEKVRVCQQFQLDGGSGDGVDGELEESISSVIRSGKLVDILNVGIEGMNAEYVRFLINLQERYAVLCEQAWELEVVKIPCISSFCQEAQNIAKTLLDENFRIHF